MLSPLVVGVVLVLKLVFTCFLLLFRGEDVAEFQPPPDYILMADCIYYEEVNEGFAEPLQKASVGRVWVQWEKCLNKHCACIEVPRVWRNT